MLIRTDVNKTDGSILNANYPPKGVNFACLFFEEAKGEDVPNEAFSEEDFEGIVKRMVFATNAEAAAYQKGVMDMDGWTEYGFYDCK